MGILTKDYHLENARGGEPKLRHISKFGFNADIDGGAVPETIWSPGGLWVPPAAPSVAAVVSDSADDALAGTGARAVQVLGLDQDFAEASEVVELNGVTPVNTVGQFSRIFRLTVVGAGSGKANAGTISAQIGPTLGATIDPGLGQTVMAVWSIPAGHRAYFLGVTASLWRLAQPAGAMATCRVVLTSGIDTPDPVEVTAYIFGLGVDSSQHIREFKRPRVLVGPADVRVDVQAVSDNNTIISAGFDAYYESVAGQIPANQ